MTQPSPSQYRMLSLLPEQRDSYTVHRYEGRPIDGDLKHTVSVVLTAAEIETGLGQAFDGEPEQPFDKDGVLVKDYDDNGDPAFVTYSLDKQLAYHDKQLVVQPLMKKYLGDRHRVCGGATVDDIISYIKYLSPMSESDKVRILEVLDRLSPPVTN